MLWVWSRLESISESLGTDRFRPNLRHLRHLRFNSDLFQPQITQIIADAKPSKPPCIFEDCERMPLRLEGEHKDISEIRVIRG
jgi:hypothetical protein